MLYKSKIQLMNDKLITSAEKCIESLKMILTKGRREQESNENVSFIYTILLTDILFEKKRIINTVEKEMECIICHSRLRCEHKVTKDIIKECHIK